MGRMEAAWYLPNETLRFINYPEVHAVQDQLKDIESYAMRVGIALNDYNTGKYDKVDVNIATLRSYIDKCRSVTGVLGRADNVCFDLLLELRAIQMVFQNVLFAYNRYGDQYVGTPTATS